MYLAKSSRNKVLLSCHWCVREKVRVRGYTNTIVRVFRSLAIGARKDRFNVCALLPLVREIRTSKLVVVRTKKGYYSSLECSGANKKGLETRLKRAIIFVLVRAG